MTTVFLSDIHAGDSKSGVTDLLEFLQKQTDITKVCMVGDILDLWVSDVSTALSAAKPLFKFLLSNFSPNDIHYILGNHDDYLLPLKDVFPVIHSSLRFPVGSKQAICFHGHVIDDNPYLKTRFSRYMSWFISKFDKWANIDTRKSLVSLSNRIRNDPYDKVLERYESNIISICKNRFDFVIIGHSHQPSIKSIDGVVIINCGDSVQHRTLVKANKTGFFLIDYSSGQSKVMQKYCLGEKIWERG